MIVTGLLLLLLGNVFLINAVSKNITGHAVLGDLDVNNQFGSAFALTLIVVGIVLFLAGKEGGLEENIRKGSGSATEFEADQADRRFRESHGVGPEDERAWVKLYHAFPRGRGISSKNPMLDASKAPDGFFLAPTEEAARQELENMWGYAENEISHYVVRISKNVYDALHSKRLFSPFLSGVGPAFKVEPKRYKTFNSLVAKGLIRFGYK